MIQIFVNCLLTKLRYHNWRWDKIEYDVLSHIFCLLCIHLISSRVKIWSFKELSCYYGLVVEISYWKEWIICHVPILVVGCHSSSASVSTNSTTCPEGWLDWNFIEMGCLWFKSEQKLTHLAAAKACSDVDSHLVEIHSQDQLNFVRDEIAFLEIDDSIWTAGTDSFTEGEWIWIHSWTPVEEFIWHSSQPYGGSKQNGLCLWKIGDSEEFMGADCLDDYETYFICQKHWKFE